MTEEKRIRMLVAASDGAKNVAAAPASNNKTLGATRSQARSDRAERWRHNLER